MINASYTKNKKVPTSSIQWTGKNRYNFITGCSEVKGAAGCYNCYANALSLKLQENKNPRYKNGFKLTIHEDKIEDPYKWKHPSLCFTNSMSDFFHEDIPDDIIVRSFEVMNNCSQHHFQILTKRTERLLHMVPKLKFTPNLWIGTSVGTNGRLDQIEQLKKVPAIIRFISYEPLLVELKQHGLEGIHWAILGGESPGLNGMRPSKINYFTSLIEQCDKYNVKVFVKQLGGLLGRDYNMTGKHFFKGGDYDKFPEGLKRREFPIEVSHLM